MLGAFTLSARLAGVSGLRARTLPVGAAALRVRVVGVRMMSATAGKVGAGRDPCHHTELSLSAR